MFGRNNQAEVDDLREQLRQEREGRHRAEALQGELRHQIRRLEEQAAQLNAQLEAERARAAEERKDWLERVIPKPEVLKVTDEAGNAVPISAQDIMRTVALGKRDMLARNKFAEEAKRRELGDQQQQEEEARREQLSDKEREEVRATFDHMIVGAPDK